VTYAHDAHCNVIHEYGPGPCPPHCEDDRHLSDPEQPEPCPSCGTTTLRVDMAAFESWQRRSRS
jgi:hypothetical protein